jgi:hypothetical protein
MTTRPKAFYWTSLIPRCKLRHPGSWWPGNRLRLATEQGKLGATCNGGTLDQNAMQWPLLSRRRTTPPLLHIIACRLSFLASLPPFVIARLFLYLLYVVFLVFVFSYDLGLAGCCLQYLRLTLPLAISSPNSALVKELFIQCKGILPWHCLPNTKY